MSWRDWFKSRQLSLMRGNVGMSFADVEWTKKKCPCVTQRYTKLFLFFLSNVKVLQTAIWIIITTTTYLFDIYDVKKQLNQNSPSEKMCHTGVALHNLNSIRNICCNDARERKRTRCDGIIISPPSWWEIQMRWVTSGQIKMVGHNVDRRFFFV
jgi:hypothetical protein